MRHHYIIVNLCWAEQAAVRYYIEISWWRVQDASGAINIHSVQYKLKIRNMRGTRESMWLAHWFVNSGSTFYWESYYIFETWSSPDIWSTLKLFNSKGKVWLHLHPVFDRMRENTSKKLQRPRFSFKLYGFNCDRIYKQGYKCIVNWIVSSRYIFDLNIIITKQW